VLCGAGLKAQGIAGEIDGVFSVDLWEIKAFSKSTQGIFPVRFKGEFKCILKHGCPTSGKLPTFGEARLLHLTDFAK
jgi:hypothetical protein